MTIILDDYAARCDHAATAQGLDPLIDRLTAERIPFGIAQTGGFNMVVTVPAATGTYGIIADGPEPAPWCMGFYPGGSFEDPDEADPEDFPMASLDVVVDRLAYLRGADQ